MDHSDETIQDSEDVRLFNDMYFSRVVPRPIYDTWAPFPRLPPELRLHIWLLFLRRYRMLEIGIAPARDEEAASYPGDLSDGVKGRYYIHRNPLGKLVSSRGYALVIEGQGFAQSLNPLLSVNREARHAALVFYRVHLPFPHQDGERQLYLNPEYDVLYVFPHHDHQSPSTTAVNLTLPWAASRLVDFLCDIRAYDPKDRGITHLALGRQYSMHMLEHRAWDDDRFPFTPSMLHPVAAAQFTDMLRHTLRTVLCVLPLRHEMRGLPETWTPPSGTAMRYHFAQTLPLRRRGLATGAFDWFDSDPREGVEFDLGQVSLLGDPLALARGWEKLERAFGVGERAGTEAFPFHICTTLNWSLKSRSMDREPARSRAHLAMHLREEAEDWLAKREFAAELGRLDGGRGEVIPRHGTVVDAETFERLERVPVTAVGMWVFPPEAFVKECVSTQFRMFDVSETRPGLLLFDVGDWK